MGRMLKNKQKIILTNEYFFFYFRDFFTRIKSRLVKLPFTI